MISVTVADSKHSKECIVFFFLQFFLYKYIDTTAKMEKWTKMLIYLKLFFNLYYFLSYDQKV